MNTAEMWTEAQKTGEIYENVGGRAAYSKALGLVDKNSLKSWGISAWDHDMDKLMACVWEKVNVEYITLKEAEKRFNIRIRQ